MADTPAAKTRAADIAMEAQGIKAVINNLTVDGGFNRQGGRRTPFRP